MCETVTFGVIAYNEEKYLPELLRNLIVQTYPKGLIEVILVDGGSTDRTKELMLEYKREYEQFFKSIKVLDNPKKVQPAGWNVVITNSTSDVILRIDAHAVLPKDFIEASMNCINSGEYVCGGPRENIIDERTKWKKTLLNAEQSLFGSGIASYRQKTEEKKYVKSVFHAAYRREVFEKVGLFNEKLIRTEDNELHYRIREAGYKICYDPSIKSYYQTRNSLPRMLRQKYQNGLWIGRTLKICPGCISLFHLVPMAFVLAIIASTVMGLCGHWWPMALVVIAYGVFVVVNTLLSLIKSKNILDVCLPLIFFLLHLSYGIGTIIGLLDWRK